MKAHCDGSKNVAYRIDSCVVVCRWQQLTRHCLSAIFVSNLLVETVCISTRKSSFVWQFSHATSAYGDPVTILHPKRTNGNDATSIFRQPFLSEIFRAEGNDISRLFLIQSKQWRRLRIFLIRVLICLFPYLTLQRFDVHSFNWKAIRSFLCIMSYQSPNALITFLASIFLSSLSSRSSLYLDLCSTVHENLAFFFYCHSIGIKGELIKSYPIFLLLHKRKGIHHLLRTDLKESNAVWQYRLFILSMNSNLIRWSSASLHRLISLKSDNH